MPTLPNLQTKNFPTFFLFYMLNKLNPALQKPKAKSAANAHFPAFA